MTIELVHELFTAIAEANTNPFRILDGQNILKGNPVAKNIFVSVNGDGLIKNGGFDTYLYEIKSGKITNTHVKQAFEEIGFTSGLEILNKARRSANLNALDMAYYQLDEEFEQLLTDYLQQHWDTPEFIAYCDSISFKRDQ
ncbi:hypothetical protein [Fluviicola sp.]|uniref:DMP19 family protein n=1 Tax=Fluviicola sp. TaxID=1917219 RepID=UPI0026052715|nr:hypothetical protein [Fluviicola sp.]